MVSVDCIDIWNSVFAATSQPDYTSEHRGARRGKYHVRVVRGCVVFFCSYLRSRFYVGSIFSAEDAWELREGRKKRYNGQRLGGTVVVHFIKKHMWFFETVRALLGGEEETEREINRRVYEESLRTREAAHLQIARHRTPDLD